MKNRKMKREKMSFAALVLVFALLFGGAAKAGEMNVNTYIDSPFTSSQVTVKHREGASEGYDGKDDPWLEPMNNNVITSYSVISESPYKLREDERPVNSTSTFLIKLDTKGSVGGGNSYINFHIIDNNDFVWKNIFAERYGTDDVNDSNNIKGLWDVKYIEAEPVTWDDAVDLGFIPSGTSGVYDQFKIKFYNYSDLNRDKRVNFKDYAIFANNFGRTDPNCGADPNNLDDYSDINRSGVVDFNDLSLFSNKWLWDANDPNTW